MLKFIFYVLKLLFLIVQSTLMNQEEQEEEEVVVEEVMVLPARVKEEAKEVIMEGLILIFPTLAYLLVYPLFPYQSLHSCQA